MKLKKLLKDLKYKASQSTLSKDVTGITVDHRKVKKGDVFIALKGSLFDGNDFVDEALERGAVAVVTDQNIDTKRVVKVDNARSAYAIMSKHFFGDACDKMKIVGVTGTNGKTTTTKTIADILKTNGFKVGVIGTMGAEVGEDVEDTGMTTPDPDKLHALFKRMQESGIKYVVMETSAHALALNKLDGIKFEVGILTNITEDHLDFFGDMESYAKAKFMLFDKNRCKKAIICEEKCFNRQSLKDINIPVVTYGIEEEGKDKPLLSAQVMQKTFDGSLICCDCNGRKNMIKTSLVGTYNVENLLASIGACLILGLNMQEIKRGASCTLPVEGRFNIINMGGFNIIIDFAHTPDGLEKVLLTTRELALTKIVVVFGCGGNRDKLKRPIMGEIASSLADEVVLTSDNPRFENPLDIIDDIKKGIKNDNVIAIADRKTAIEYVLKNSRPHTTIIIAGKGGEKYQDIDGIKYPYNDFDVVKNFFINKYKMLEKQTFEREERHQECKENRFYGDIEL